ncbi:MAG: tRNA lysidine(34) synthetase TilS [Pseudomonadota bacterium]
MGFSGGGDSLAVLMTLVRVAQADGRALHAFIVDHRLRETSAADAQRAADLARRIGAEPSILVWSNPRPGQAAARRARHGLLAEAVRECGAHRLFLAHTLDDQRETVAMRLERSDAARGLAGMDVLSPSPAWPEGRGILIARPALAHSRRALRQALREGEAPDWIEDPSNADRRYERVRVRAELQRVDAATLEELDRRQAGSRREEDGLRAAASRLIADGVISHDWGGFSLQPPAFQHADAAVGLRAMEALIVAASGAVMRPAGSAPQRLLEALHAGIAATAGGAALTQGGVLGRDPGAATGRGDGASGAAGLQLRPSQSGVYDGRFEICAGPDAPCRIRAWARRSAGDVAMSVPAALRPGLCRIEPGPERECLVAGLSNVKACAGAPGVHWLGPERIMRTLFRAEQAPEFDAAFTLGG